MIVKAKIKFEIVPVFFNPKVMICKCLISMIVFICDCVEDSEDDNLNDISGLTAIVPELETVSWCIVLPKDFSKL